MKKWIYSAVSLAVLIALIYLGIGLFDRAKFTLSLIAEGQQDAQRTAMEYDIVKYDGHKIVGSTAITYIKTVVSKYEVPVQVTTTKGTFTCDSSAFFAKLRDIDADQFINPMVEYEVRVIRDENDMISAVHIIYVK